MHLTYAGLLSRLLAAALATATPWLCAQSQSPVPNGSLGQAYQWQLVFADEFSASSVDTTKWSPSIFWGITSNGSFENLTQLEWYFPANAAVANGVLTLQARQETTLTPYGVFNYTSGLITTDRNADNTSIPVKFDFLYGYVEIRAKVPAGKGLWPAFWMLPSDQTASEEIDILEILGDDPATNYMTYHWGTQQSTGSFYKLGNATFAQDYHTYAVDWSESAIVWYIDGVERQRITDPTILPKKRMDLIANLQVGGNWAGAPDANTIFPANYDIDYIRVWKKGAALPPPPPPPPVVTKNILVNPSLETGLTPWSLDVKSGASATLSRDTASVVDGKYSALIKITRTGSSDWYVQFVQGKIPVVKDHPYVIKFFAKADRARPLALVVQQNNSPYTELARQTINLSTQWTEYTVVFSSPMTEADAKLSFSLGAQTGKVWLDQLNFGY